MLSVIIPVYNQQTYLANCLDSIFSQSISDFEVILVDDGSTDGSRAICRDYEQRYGNVHAVRKKNGGVSSARNCGIERASGELLYFADADDSLAPESLAMMVKRMMDTTIDLFIGGYVIKNEEENVIYDVPESGSEVLTREQGIEQLYRPRLYRYQGYIWNKMFRRSIIEKNHIRFDESISFNEDRLFVTQYIAAQTGAIFFDSTPVYTYYERRGGAMASLHKGFNQKFVTDFEAMIKMLKVIRHSFSNTRLKELAENGVLTSYALIHNMMKDNGDLQRRTHLSMKLQLFCSLSPLYLVRKKIEFIKNG